VDVQDRFFMRNTLGTWVCLAALAAIGLVRLRGIPLAAYLAASVAIVLWIQGDWRYRNSDWSAAVDALGERAEGRPVVAYPGLDAPVAARYLHRQIATGPVQAGDVWVIVEPSRQNRRELTPVRGSPRGGLPGFRQVEAFEHRGFRVLRFRAPAPRPLDPPALPRDAIGGPPAVLPP
jgi:hypothetical protein